MTDGDDLFRAVVQSPQDDHVRLVYADWLTENGQPERGEFIRVQIELFSLPKSDPRREPLEARERELLDAHARQWRGELGRYLRSPVFERGFVSSDKLDLHDWLYSKYEPPWVDTARAVALAACPSSYWLTKLELDVSPLGDDGAAALASSRYLTRLTSLGLGGDPARRIPSTDGERLTVEGVRALVESRNVANLTFLALSCRRLGDEAVKVLANAPNLRQLEHLYLHENDVGEEGVQALVDSPYLDNLTDLGLSDNPAGPYIDYGRDWDGTVVGPSTIDMNAVRALEARFANRNRRIRIS